jgi:ADP-heptose:LPS heptosyltransferase
LTLLSGAKRKVGYKSSRNRWVYNTRVTDSREIWKKRNLHTVEHQLSPLISLGFEIPKSIRLGVYFRNEDLTWVQQQLRSKEINDEFILIHPAAAFTTKQWGSERFAQLVEILIEDKKNVVITAGPGEDQLIDSIARLSKKNPVIFPPLSINRFSALTSLCQLYIGNDTGTTHIAAALNKPIVVIFGSSDSKVWYPWGTDYRLISSDLPCVPCPGYRCLHYDSPRCIESISVDQVLSSTREILQSKSTRNRNEIKFL